MYIKDNPKYIRFKSAEPQTPFAPTWDYIMYEGVLQDIDFACIKKYILDREDEILSLSNTIKNKKVSDGYTGLGKDSTTSRFDKFNVLSWQYDEIQKLKLSITEFHDHFLDALNFRKPQELYIQCWANIMRKGEEIKPHIHSVNQYAYLGGHICIQAEETATHYINPVNQINDPEIYSSKNEAGNITLFQNCIPHYTDVHNNDRERITIAFDLTIKSEGDNFIKLY